MTEGYAFECMKPNQWSYWESPTLAKFRLRVRPPLAKVTRLSLKMLPSSHQCHSTVPVWNRKKNQQKKKRQLRINAISLAPTAEHVDKTKAPQLVLYVVIALSQWLNMRSTIAVDLRDFGRRISPGLIDPSIPTSSAIDCRGRWILLTNSVSRLCQWINSFC